MARRPIQKNLLASLLLLSPMLPIVGCVDDEPDAISADGGSFEDAATNGTTDGGTAPDATIVAAVDGSVVDAAWPTPDGAVNATGDTWALDSTGALVLFDRKTGGVERVVPVTKLPAGESIWGIDVRPADGSLVAVSSAGKLYVIDATSGIATVKSTLVADPADSTDPFSVLTGGAYGVDFNPVADRLRVVSKTGQNLRINVDTGLVTTDAAINPATPISEAAYTNSFAATCRTRLYVIDADGKQLYLQDPPNDGKLTVIGSLGAAVTGPVHGFEIVTGSDGSNVALVGFTGSDGEHIAEVNLSTGLATALPGVVAIGGATLQHIFAAPPGVAPTQLPGELLATTESNKLVSFMRGAPGKLCTSVTVTGLANGEDILGADVRPADGKLYALTNGAKLYTLDVVTGVATAKSTLIKATDADPFSGLGEGAELAVGFNPVPDRLRVISNRGDNLRINVDDGKVTTDTAISQAEGTPCVSAVAYTNAFAGAKSTTLFGIDSVSDALVRIGGNPADGAACPNATNPNCGVSSLVQPLGIAGDVTPINGFDIDGTTGVALAALAIGDGKSSTLYVINPNGDLGATPPVPVAVVAGAIGGGERVRSLTLAATPKLTAWVVTADNKLVSFAPAAPQTSLTQASLTGLQANETLVGIDVRPLDGKLYGVGSSGRLYTVGADGKATEVAALSAAAQGGFSTLPSSTFGFDFNPAADALRVVDQADDNFRVLPSARTVAGNPLVAGATFVDGALNPAGANIVAAAYTNSFAGSTTTTLYVLGGSVSTLSRQGGLAGTPSPNTGALTTVGALGVDSALDIGFDIAGGHNGLALAAIDQAGSATLYTINLNTGAATAFNASNSVIANAASPLRGLALELK